MITFLSTIAKQVIKYFSFNRGKSNNRSNDNEEEDTDWPPEELIFEYTLKHAKGKKSIPKDVMYVRFLLILLAWIIRGHGSKTMKI